MFFGKYLIEKQFINSSQLIEGMAFQFESQPSLLRLLQESNYIDDEKIIELIDETLVNHKSMVAVLIEKEIISDEQIADLLSSRSRKGVGLGQSLITLGHLDIRQLDEALKEYAKIKPEVKVESASPAETTSPEVEKTENTEDSGEAGVSAAALESLKELGITDEATMAELEKSATAPTPEVEAKTGPETETPAEAEKNSNGMTFHGLESEFLNVFNDDLYQSFLDRVKTLVKGYDQELLETIHKDIKHLEGASSLSDLDFTEKILSCYSNVFEAMLDKKIDFSTINFLELGSAFKEAVVLSWDLRNSIKDHQSEKNMFEDGDWKEKFMNNLKKGYGFIN